MGRFSRLAILVGLVGLAGCGDGGFELSADSEVLVRVDGATHEAVCVRPPNGLDANRLGYGGWPGGVSEDGRYVVFSSGAAGLVDGDDLVWVSDVFLWDVAEGSVVRLSESPAGDGGSGRGGVMSSDGSVVAFVSGASNLVEGDDNEVEDVFVWVRGSGVVERVEISFDGAEVGGLEELVMSADGNVLAVTAVEPDDYSGAWVERIGLFVYNRHTGEAKRFVTDVQRYQHLVISGDGEYVGFSAGSTYLMDVETGDLEPVAVYGEEERLYADGSYLRGISPDGRFVVFDSADSSWVEGDLNNSDDVFLLDRQTGTVERIPLSGNGEEGDGQSRDGSVSNDGRYIAFNSSDSTLSEEHTEGNFDVYLADREMGTLERVSVSTDEQVGSSISPVLSGNGRVVAFTFWRTQGSRDFSDVCVAKLR